MATAKRPVRDRKLAQAFGARLNDLRRRAGLSQEQLGHNSGMSVPFVSGLERGIRQPSLQSLTRLAAGLGVSVEDLVRGLDKGSPANEDQVSRVAQAMRGMSRKDAAKAVEAVDEIAGRKS